MIREMSTISNFTIIIKIQVFLLIFRSSTENSRPEACYFPITRIMDALLLSNNKYNDLFCMAKSLNFEIFNFLDESEGSQYFLKNFIF